MATRGLERAGNVAEALSQACEAFAQLSRTRVNPLTRSIITKRLLASAESGEEDPKKWVEAALGGFGSSKGPPPAEKAGPRLEEEQPSVASDEIVGSPSTDAADLHRNEIQERGEQIRKQARELAKSQGNDWGQLSKEERRELKKRARQAP